MSPRASWPTDWERGPRCLAPLSDLLASERTESVRSRDRTWNWRCPSKSSSCLLACQSTPRPRRNGPDGERIRWKWSEICSTQLCPWGSRWQGLWGAARRGRRLLNSRHHSFKIKIEIQLKLTQSKQDPIKKNFKSNQTWNELNCLMFWTSPSLISVLIPHVSVNHSINGLSANRTAFLHSLNRRSFKSTWSCLMSFRSAIETLWLAIIQHKNSPKYIIV